MNYIVIVYFDSLSVPHGASYAELVCETISYVFLHKQTCETKTARKKKWKNKIDKRIYVSNTISANRVKVEGDKKNRKKEKLK